MHQRPSEPQRPLLKWAGGKRQLLPLLQPYYPPSFRRYIEPFFGSGAVFFDLHAAGRLTGRAAWLVDDNVDLIGCYLALRDHAEAVIGHLHELADGHARSDITFYYEVRDQRFNAATRTLEAYTPELAAMLIYLNRTGFNGLFRLNRLGEFNVPAGRYMNPRICDPMHLRQVGAALRRPEVTIERASFERPLADAGPGDFVYCDPPYAPITKTARFANYTAAGFGARDQEQLQAAVIEAVGRGATVLLSNSTAPEIERLYSSDRARAAGLRLRRIPARRAINSRATARGPIDELLVTNAFPVGSKLKMARSAAPAVRQRRLA